MMVGLKYFDEVRGLIWKWGIRALSFSSVSNCYHKKIQCFSIKSIYWPVMNIIYAIVVPCFPTTTAPLLLVFAPRSILIEHCISHGWSLLVDRNGVMRDLSSLAGRVPFFVCIIYIHWWSIFTNWSATFMISSLQQYRMHVSSRNSKINLNSFSVNCD